jgi:rhodanese-related sulfurtransferase
MQEVIEFATRHPLLVGAFVALLVALLVTELLRLGHKVKLVGSAEAIRLINREDAAVVDVSSSADHQRAHIVGAIHVSPSQIGADHPSLKKLRGRPVLVYCRTGQASWQAARKLQAAGLDPVHVLRGGLAQWQQDQQPVATG